MRKILGLLLLTLLLMMGCFGGGDSAGNNEGSGSEIVGTVDSGSTRITLGDSRLAVDGAEVYLFKADYKASGGEDPRVYTNEDGEFVIDSATTENNIGNWLLEASTPDYSLVAAVNVKGDGKRIDLKTVKILEKAGIDITINTNIDTDLEYAIYVLGTRWRATGDEDKLNVKLDGIPTGEVHNVRLEVTKPITAGFTQSISLKPGQIGSLTFTVNK